MYALYKIRERQTRGVGVIDMASHNERERADTCRPKNIRVARGLGATFHHPLVNRAELIHVIALVGAGAGVEK